MIHRYCIKIQIEWLFCCFFFRWLFEWFVSREYVPTREFFFVCNRCAWRCEWHLTYNRKFRRTTEKSAWCSWLAWCLVFRDDQRIIGSIVNCSLPTVWSDIYNGISIYRNNKCRLFIIDMQWMKQQWQSIDFMHDDRLRAYTIFAIYLSVYFEYE